MRSLKHESWAVACVAVAVVFAGCMGAGPQCSEVAKAKNIDVGIRNAGTERIETATVRFGEYTFRAGIITPGHKKVHVGSGQAVPAEATVQYEMADGRDYTRAVVVKAHMPTGRVDVVHFVVDGAKDVTVEFLQFNKVDDKWTLDKLR